jgi:hypothetical protein
MSDSSTHTEQLQYVKIALHTKYNYNVTESSTHTVQIHYGTKQYTQNTTEVCQRAVHTQ